MRRCYKCGAKMTTDYIVCPECEQEIEGRRRMNFDADRYWKKHEKDCPYAEGNKCFIVHEPSNESCKGCRWYEYSKRGEAE